MVKVTKYRTINDGYVDFLQYEAETKGLFGTTKKWKYVWAPHYDEIWGRDLDSCGYDTYLNDYNENLETFPARYPDIAVYFKEAEIEQAKLVQYAKEKRMEREGNKGKIKYL